MAKKKIEVRQRSCGKYERWDAEAADLPRFLEATKRIDAVVGVEFGFVVNIRGAKNKELYDCIDHPGILEDKGHPRPPFDGWVYIKQNDWSFYLGDTIWEPISDKLGPWRMTLELDDRVIADETFEVTAMDALE